MIFLLLKLKGAPSGPIPSLAIEKSLKMVKIASYFTLKALLIYEVFTFLSWRFGHVEKRCDQKDKVNFKIYYATTWETNNCNTHSAQYLIKLRRSGKEIGSVNRI